MAFSIWKISKKAVFFSISTMLDNKVIVQSVPCQIFVELLCVSNSTLSILIFSLLFLPNLLLLGVRIRQNVYALPGLQVFYHSDFSFLS